MKILLDTHLLLWSAGQPEKLSRIARELIEDQANEPVFSAVSLWEIAIKRGLGRADFQAEPRLLRLLGGFYRLIVDFTSSSNRSRFPTAVMVGPLSLAAH